MSLVPPPLVEEPGLPCAPSACGGARFALCPLRLRRSPVCLVPPSACGGARFALCPPPLAEGLGEVYLMHRLTLIATPLQLLAHTLALVRALHRPNAHTI